MKRLLTTIVVLLAMVSMAWSASATQNQVKGGARNVASGLKINPQASMQLRSETSPQESNSANIIAKVPVKTASGEEWEMTLERTYNVWSELINYGSFEEMPYYLVNCILRKYNDEIGLQHYIALNLFWPAKSHFDPSASNDLVDFEDLVSHAGDGGNVFSTQGNIYNAESNNLTIWNTTGDLYSSIINGENTYDNLLSFDAPTTITVTKDEVSGIYKFETVVNFTSSDIIGVPTLTLSSEYDETPSSFNTNNFPSIYYTGDANGWDYSNGKIPLYKDSQDIPVYTGVLRLTHDQPTFRFYGKLRDWDSWSIGSSDTEGEVVYVTCNTNDVYEGPLVIGGYKSSKGLGNWKLENWDGGLLGVTVDLDNKKVTYRKMEEPENLYPYFEMISNPGDVSASPIERIGEGTYSGIINIPEVYQQNKGDLVIRFIDNADSQYDRKGYTIMARNSERLRVSRTEALGEIAPSNGYGFIIDNYKGTRLKVDIDMHNGVVKFSNPDLEPLTAEDAKLTFASELPDNLVLGKAYDIKVTYDSDMLDGANIWFYAEQGQLDHGVETNGEGAYSVTIVPTVEGQLDLCFTSNYHSELGFEPLKKTFTVIASDLSATAGEKITLRGKSQSGDLNVTLTKESEGIYSGNVDISGETVFRLSVPTANGEIVLANICESYNWLSIYDTEGESYYNYTSGYSNATYTRYNLHEVQTLITDHPEMYYLGYLTTGKFKFKVNLNTMKLTVTDPEFVPYITATETDMQVKKSNEFSVKVETNVGEDVYNTTNNIVVDNPEIANFNWVNRYNGEVWEYVFNAGDVVGETDIHITSDLLKEVGLEAVVHVKVADLKVESITLSESEISMPKGSFRRINATSAPIAFENGWMHTQYMEGSEEAVTLDTRSIAEDVIQITILAEQEGDVEYEFVANDNDEARARLKIHVLPADVKVAEHVVYMTLPMGSMTSLKLNDHHDGSAATPTWSSSDQTVATVDDQGNVTAVGVGTAHITSDCGEHQMVTGITVHGATDVEELPASNAYVYSRETTITVGGTTEGQIINIYGANGALITTRISDGSTMRFNIGAKGAYVVSVAGQSFKVVM